MGLFFFVCLSYLWSVSPENTWKHIEQNLPYLGAFILIMPLCATDAKQLRLVVNTTVILGAIILLGHGFSGYGRRSVILAIEAGKTLEGNPLAVATYSGYVGICALFSIYGRKFSPLIALKGAIFLLAAYVIVRSSSRGQLIALAAVSFLWLPIIARATMKRSTILAFLGAIVIVGAFIYTIDQLKDTGRWQAAHYETATIGRLEMSMTLLDYWWKKGAGAWLLGLGSSSSYKIVGFYPHNVPAEVLGEEGLIGFSIYLAFIYYVLSRAGKIMFSPMLSTEGRVNLGILLAIFCFEGILTLKQGSLIGNCGWFGVGLTIGWITSQMQADVKRSKREQFRTQMHQGFLHAPPQAAR